MPWNKIEEASTGCLKKVNRNETIEYHYAPSGQQHLSIFNLDSHTFHLKVVHQTLEIQARKVKIYSTPELRLELMWERAIVNQEYQRVRC